MPSRTYAIFRADGDGLDRSRAALGAFTDAVGHELAELDPRASFLAFEGTGPEPDVARFLGLSSVPPTGDVHVLAWPAGKTCTLSPDLGARDGALVVALRHDALAVVGGDASPLPRTMIVDLTRGGAAPPTADMLVPRVRAAAAVTEGSLVVAGGVDPRDGSLIASAELMSVAEPAFETPPVALSLARADHAAVALAAGGVLLIGGRGSSGALDAIELVDARERRSRSAGLVRLTRARIAPTAVRLIGGDILVVGGFDDAGNAVGGVEWIARDGTRLVRPLKELAPSSRVRALAFEGGGALVVQEPAAGSSSSTQRVWRISRDGIIEPGGPLSGPLGEFELVRGPSDRALLHANGGWWRFDPWENRFETALELSPLTRSVRGSVAAIDAGLSTWLVRDGATVRLDGMRVDTTSEHSEIQVIAFGADDAHVLVPDRALEPASLAIRWNDADGLVLDLGARVTIADRTFSSFDMRLERGGAPIVRVELANAAGATTVVGDATCAFDDGASSITIERRGGSLTVKADDRPIACDLDVGGDPVRVVLVGSEDKARAVRRVTIDRR